MIDQDGYKAAVAAHFRASNTEPAIELAIEAYLEVVEAKKEPELDQEGISAAVRTLQSSNAYRTWRHRVEDAIRAYLAALPKEEPLADWEIEAQIGAARLPAPVVVVNVSGKMTTEETRNLVQTIEREIQKRRLRDGRA